MQPRINEKKNFRLALFSSFLVIILEAASVIQLDSIYCYVGVCLRVCVYIERDAHTQAERE